VKEYIIMQAKVNLSWEISIIVVSTEVVTIGEELCHNLYSIFSLDGMEWFGKQTFNIVFYTDRHKICARSFSLLHTLGHCSHHDIPYMLMVVISLSS
jgi:Zn-dependent peptidase ImmA (M78 family)